MKEPTDAELRILRKLWDSGPLRLRELCSALDSEGKWAKTTVATMLKVMREKGLVERSDREGKTVWKTRVRQETTSRQSLWNVIDRFFDGSAQQLVSNLLTDRKLSDEDRSEIEALIRNREENDGC